MIQQHSIALLHVSYRPLNARPVAIPGHQVLPVHHEALVRVLAGLQEYVVGRHHVESFVGEVFESLLDTAADEFVLCRVGLNLFLNDAHEWTHLQAYILFSLDLLHWCWDFEVGRQFGYRLSYKRGPTMRDLLLKVSCVLVVL